MMLRRLVGVSADSLRRLRRSMLPTLLLMVALSAPVAIAAGVPLYADAAAARLLDDRIAPDEDDTADAELDDRLAFLFSYNRLGGGSRTWAEVEAADDYFTGDAAPGGLALDRVDRFVETNSVSLVLPAAESNAPESDDESVEAEEVATVTFASVTGFDTIARFVDGRAPVAAAADAGASGAAPIEVAIEREFAELEELVVGDSLVVVDRDALLDAPGRLLEVRIVGVWDDGDDPGPFGGAAAFRRRLVVPNETIAVSLSPRRTDALQNVRWRLALDPQSISGDSVSAILDASDELNATAASLLPGTRRLTAPSGLREFRDDERALRRGLTSFSLPLLALASAVGFLIVSITVRRRGAEFAMARRRGTPARLLLFGSAAEAVVIAAGAVLVGLALAIGVAETIGRTRTFFRFSTVDELDVGLSTSVVGPTLAIGVLLVALQLAPTAALLRRERPTLAVRSDVDATVPWWQRTYLDLFAVVLIAVVTLRGVRNGDGRSALLDDPAVILLPSAAALAAGLIVLRGVPLVMRVVAAVLERGDRTAALLAARRAARVPGDIAAPLLLLVLTASLATFTASLAVTLDLQLLDSAHHRVGAEAHVIDRGVDSPEPSPFAAADELIDSALPQEAPLVTRHAALDSYDSVWGVESASPMIEVTGTATTRTEQIPGLLFRGVDPESFAATAFWRSDYASDGLSDLMAPLAAAPNAVLVASDLARSAGLDVGSTLRLDLITNGVGAEFDAVVVGTFDQFPRWFPDRQSPLVVGRADTVEALAGATHDRTVLLRPGPRFADQARVANDFAGRGADVGAFRFTDLSIAAQQDEPGRQGVLGLLTIGVALATVLTLAGFVVSTVVSFSRRTTELGILRAMGMTRREVTTLALFDLATVMVLGLAIAVALGLALSRWFIPVLVDTPPGAAPELLPAIAWSAAGAIVLVLAVLLAVSGMIVAATLRRIRLYEAIRLGSS
ncbi:MAG: FtsX-like permease family protein [Ilumatobacter sp.]